MQLCMEPNALILSKCIAVLDLQKLPYLLSSSCAICVPPRCAGVEMCCCAQSATFKNAKQMSLVPSKCCSDSEWMTFKKVL